jgi:hypothetical protein
LEKVNDKIREKADSESDENDIKWNHHEQLKKQAGLFGGLKCISVHSRKNGLPIEIRHFWVKLR